jgi:cytosine/adenosine deaminase-related metal-dependent hydrolase
MEIAKRYDKPIDVHVDQENNPRENETELLAEKTIDHGLEGRVYGVHAVSLAAKTPQEQDRIIARLRDADVGIIVCPSAAVSMKPLEMTSPIHNSIAPVVKLREQGVRLYLGVDNIHDLFMPVVDGDIWFECRMLMETCRFYNIDAVAQIATARIDPPAIEELAANVSNMQC